MSDYASRDNVLHADGTRVFATAEDREHEQDVRRAVEKSWKCELHHFGDLCPVDFYATRDERIVAVVECKARSHPSTQFPTVFFNVRKWLALTMASIGMGVPAFMVFKFTDKILYTRTVDERGKLEMGGCRARVKSSTDREPVFCVPVASMKELQHGPR